MSTTSKIQRQLLETTAAVDLMKATVDNTVQRMLEDKSFYRLYDIENHEHPYFNLQRLAKDLETNFFRFAESVLGWKVSGKTIREYLTEATISELSENVEGDVVERLCKLNGRANSAKIAAQHLLATYEGAAELGERAHPKAIRRGLIRLGERSSNIKELTDDEKFLHKVCAAVRKEVIKLSRAIRHVDRDGETIDYVLQSEQTMLLLKHGDSGAVGVLLK